MEDTDLLCLPNGVQGRVQPSADFRLPISQTYMTLWAAERVVKGPRDSSTGVLERPLDMRHR